ncbi:MAG: ATP-dependent metallopeptidase FtsH/Yme1/Tma family protein, partial [Acidimicrobiales bacterium]|nr:ATP-dependent metallopeptidase FtsH/Yme1/Tma family protein [Acidimicrobiales bacterium]
MPSEVPPPPPPPPPPPRRGSQGRGPQGSSNGLGPAGAQSNSRIVVYVIVAVAVIGFLLLVNRSPDRGDALSYTEFRAKVTSGEVREITYDNNTGGITGEFKDGSKFHTTGLQPFPEADQKLLQTHKVDLTTKTPTPTWWETWLPFLFIPILVVIFLLFQRRAQGQMGNIMSIGRSKAKTYSTERPGTTFADVAGYEGVKTEIREVVDFLKYPEKFAQIGARIPKGVLLVGPPGTGKTLIARAVAGEAGVPFLSVSGSDFMEMFVGVGASRVRDLFNSARKMGRAIIFIDEIDSIGR